MTWAQNSPPGLSCCHSQGTMLISSCDSSTMTVRTQMTAAAGGFLKLESQPALPVSNENTDRARILTALGFLFNLRSILWLERQEKRPCQ